jgi:mannobiose 2-epimerase
LGDRLALLVWDGYAVARADRAHPPVRRVAGPAPDPRFRDAGLYRTHVLKELLPFWEAHAPDSLHGGFVQHLDRRGAVTDPAGEKSSAMQARFLYAFAAGYILNQDPRHLALARRGLSFLMEHLWDEAEGGWYQSVERDGRPRGTTKPLFSQAYALVGVLEYFRATRDPSVAATIARAWELIDRRAWDGAHGGYVERCGPRWEVVSDLKTSCVHLDLLAAAITTFELFGTLQDLDRVRRLADVAAHRLRDPVHGLLLEVYHRDWRYYPAATRDRVQVGHVLKGARALLEASSATGDETFAAAGFALADAALRHGWDPEHGGFYFLISRNGRVADSTKLWWHQCEALAALAHLAAVADVPRYRETFLRLAEFCFTCFVDPEHGEWFTSCAADGRVLDSFKGGRYKAAYHTVAACVHTALWLERWPLPSST